MCVENVLFNSKEYISFHFRQNAYGNTLSVIIPATVKNPLPYDPPFVLFHSNSSFPCVYSDSVPLHNQDRGPFRVISTKYVFLPKYSRFV